MAQIKAESKQETPDDFLFEDYQWPKYTGYQLLSQDAREIRLLTVWLDDCFALHGSIEHATLNDPPAYEALSYYWGPPSRQKAICISNESVAIRESLHSFLQTLCSNKDSILVWVDSLCINQQDVDERNWQVSMMGEIYRLAFCTNIWLGDGDADSEYVFAYLQRYDSLQNDEGIKHDLIRRRARNCLPQLAGRAYWKRAWIVQEVGLATDVQVLCGSRTVKWKMLLDGLSALHPVSRSSLISAGDPAPLAFILQLEELRKSIRGAEQQGNFTIFDRVSQFGHHTCEDERDKVFAMLSLVEPHERISVDYRKTIADIILDASWLILSRTQPLNSAYSPLNFSNVLRSVSKSIIRFDMESVLMGLHHGDESNSWCHYLRSKSYQRSSDIAQLQDRLINMNSDHVSAQHVRYLYNEQSRFHFIGKEMKSRTVTGVVFHLPKLKPADIGPEFYDHEGIKLVIGRWESSNGSTIAIEGATYVPPLSPGELLLMDCILSREIQICRQLTTNDDFCVITCHYSRWAIIVLIYVLTMRISDLMMDRIRALHIELRRYRPVPQLCNCTYDVRQNEKALKLFQRAFNTIKFRQR